MKLNNFNKLSGTELRTKNILNTFSTILMWIKEKTAENDYIFKENELEKEFKEYCNIEGIYQYNDNSGIKRFGMLISKLNGMGFIQKENKKCKLNADLINERDLTNTFFQAILSQGTHKEFNSMIEFIYQRNDIETIPLYFAMTTFQDNDNFNDLYEFFAKFKTKDECIDYLAKISVQKCLANISKYSQNLNFKKPSKVQKPFQKILQYKILNQDLPFDFFNNIDIKDISEYTREFSKNNKKFNYYDFYNELNIEEFVLLIEKLRLSKLLNKEYFDIWFRWMKDFGFLQSSKDKMINSSFIKFNNGQYYIFDQTKELENYPYQLEQVNEWLKQVDLLDSEQFKYQKLKIFGRDSQLINITRATLAEYLVNLKFAYLLQINPKDFKEYSNTIVNNKLEPISHAPGKQADFSYFDKDKNLLINVETTLLNTFEQLHNHETSSNIRHAITNARDIQCKSIILYNIIISDINEMVKDEYKKALNQYLSSHIKLEGSENEFKNIDIKVDNVNTFEWLYKIKHL
ncbi:hypothetical protein ACX1NA_00055 [Mycoplasma sp. VS276A1]